MSTRNGTATPTTQRKTLASQIDRLDLILDGFSDALDESVADQVHNTVHQAVESAVQKTLQRLLTNSNEMQGIVSMAMASAQEQRRQRSVWRQRWQDVQQSVGSFCQRSVATIGSGYHRAEQTIRNVVTILWQWRHAAVRMAVVMSLVFLFSLLFGNMLTLIVASVSSGILAVTLSTPTLHDQEPVEHLPPYQPPF